MLKFALINYSFLFDLYFTKKKLERKNLKQNYKDIPILLHSVQIKLFHCEKFCLKISLYSQCKINNFLECFEYISAINFKDKNSNFIEIYKKVAYKFRKKLICFEIANQNISLTNQMIH